MQFDFRFGEEGFHCPRIDRRVRVVTLAAGALFGGMQDHAGKHYLLICTGERTCGAEVDVGHGERALVLDAARAVGCPLVEVPYLVWCLSYRTWGPAVEDPLRPGEHD